MEGKLLAEIQDISDHASELYAKEDHKGFSELYTEDCRFLPPGGDVMIGREGVEKGNISIAQAGFLKTTFKALEVIKLNEEYVIERGSYNTYNKDGKLNDEGKFVALWKRVDGKLLNDLVLFNSNKPSGGVTVSC